MEATAHRRPKGTDLEDMYSFLPDQLKNCGKDTEMHREMQNPVMPGVMPTFSTWTAKQPNQVIQAAACNGKRASSLSHIRKEPPIDVPRRGRGTSTGATRKGLVWKPKQGYGTAESYAGDRVRPALFRRGGC